MEISIQDFEHFDPPVTWVRVAVPKKLACIQPIENRKGWETLPTTSRMAMSLPSQTMEITS